MVLTKASFTGTIRLFICLKSQISNLYFNKVTNSPGFLLHIKYNYITIFNNNKYMSKESLKNTTQNYTKAYMFSMNAVYLTLLTKMKV